MNAETNAPDDLTIEPSSKSRATKALEWAGRGGLACAVPGAILGGILGGRIIPIEGIQAGVFYGLLAAGIFGLITFTIVGEFYTEDAPEVQLPPLLRRAQLGLFQSFAAFWIFTFLLRWMQHTTTYDPGAKDSRLVFFGSLVCAAGALKVFVPTVPEADANTLRTMFFFVVRYAGLLFAQHLVSLMWRTIYAWWHPLTARPVPWSSFVWMLSFGFGNVIIAAALAGSVAASFSLRVRPEDRRKVETKAFKYSIIAVLVLSAVQIPLNVRGLNWHSLTSTLGVSPVELLIILSMQIFFPPTGHWACFAAIVLGAAVGAYQAFANLSSSSAMPVAE